ncbi:MAG: HPr kinase/phosphatase C-terminal domain-containing protein [Bradyrhizobium sp.]|uniref:HPr kinase/phosphorylase n=1 Tax=Bradyrhizobium sp. TaxID=376 RepID=UPI0025BC0540|nr:HPr kinase/phosphatase C-terminal domain-containing protein [Bradyrhizobium sp.]MBI5260895.1 HPr kinase/phosphatase C-terminal domain-containing protein [Bradyrhizobium sp.]
MSLEGTSVHASAVRVGNRAALIRGPSGAGKSRLAFDLILAGRAGLIEPAVLVGDDRVYLAPEDGQVVVRPAAGLAGLIEIRGLGIRRCDHVDSAVVALVVDLDARDAERLPRSEALTTSICGAKVPRIPVGRGFSPVPLVIAALTTTESSPSGNLSGDCLKEIGNHMSSTIATE